MMCTYSIKRPFGFIGSGCNNMISRVVNKAFIGGGSDNMILATADNSSIPGGNLGCIHGNCAVITGGYCNELHSDGAGIFSGICNTIGNLSPNSAILEGACDTIPGGLDHAAVFGCNVTAVVSCSLHANQFLSQNIQPYLGLVPGLLQTLPAPAILGFPVGTLIVVTS